MRSEGVGGLSPPAVGQSRSPARLVARFALDAPIDAKRSRTGGWAGPYLPTASSPWPRVVACGRVDARRVHYRSSTGTRSASRALELMSSVAVWLAGREGRRASGESATSDCVVHEARPARVRFIGRLWCGVLRGSPVSSVWIS